MTNHESSHRQDLLNKWHEICSWDVRVGWPSYKWSHPVSGFPFYVLCPQNRFQNLIFSAPCQTGSFPGGTSVKEPACQCRRCKRCGFNPWAGKIPWRRAQQPTSVFLPGEFHGQRSLVGYSALGQKSWAPLKWLSTHAQGQHCDFSRKYRWDHHNVAVTSLGNAHSSGPSKQIEDPSALMWTSHLSSSSLSILRPFCTKERDYFQHS